MFHPRGYSLSLMELLGACENLWNTFIWPMISLNVSLNMHGAAKNNHKSNTPGFQLVGADDSLDPCTTTGLRHIDCTVSLRLGLGSPAHQTTYCLISTSGTSRMNADSHGTNYCVLLTRVSSNSAAVHYCVTYFIVFSLMSLCYLCCHNLCKVSCRKVHKAAVRA